MTDTITFTPEKKEELHKLYEQAVKNGKGQFMFDGRKLVTAYAKYLLQYLNGFLP